MSAKKMGLGRGLNTLIPKAPIVDEEDVEQVKKKVSRSSKTKKKEETKKELTLPIDKIEPNPDQPRNQFDEDTLQELADSIKQYGMLQPCLLYTSWTSGSKLPDRFLEESWNLHETI